MKVVRETPTAINEPMLILGVDRMVVGGLFSTCVLIAKKGSDILAIILFFGLFFAAKYYLKGDPNALNRFIECWKFKPVYDPINRKPFEMEIGE